MVETLYPEVGIAAADILERHGVEVLFPDGQTCCGQPSFNAGYRNDARKLARHFLDVFWPLVDAKEVDAVVAPSGSCVAMVTHFYEVLFERSEYTRDRTRARQVAAVTYELTQYLVDVLGVATTDAHFSGRLTYHPCCHLLRELKVDAQPRRLLAGVKDAEMVELPGATECCGFGGLFALKNAPISAAMGRRKVENILASKAEAVAVNDVSCMTHLNGLLKREGHSCRAMHVVQVLNGKANSTASHED
jgi:L-lactate dehydrogenase complex protein LldE